MDGFQHRLQVPTVTQFLIRISDDYNLLKGSFHQCFLTGSFLLANCGCVFLLRCHYCYFSWKIQFKLDGQNHLLFNGTRRPFLPGPIRGSVLAYAESLVA